MKKLFTSVLLLAFLVACSPALISRVEGGWRVEAKDVGGFVIGASRDITHYLSVAPCSYRSSAAGARRAIECNAPNVVTVETAGQIDVQALPEAPISVR